jgi:hypothetical protein
MRFRRGRSRTQPVKAAADAEQLLLLVFFNEVLAKHAV